MGATCKFKKHIKESSEIHTEIRPNPLESSLKVQTGFTGRDQQNYTRSNSPNKFYVIYPKNGKNKDQFKQLHIQLQHLNKKNIYRIEELEVMSSDLSHMKNVESYFSLCSEENGSFNIFKM